MTVIMNVHKALCQLFGLCPELKLLGLSSSIGTEVVSLASPHWRRSTCSWNAAPEDTGKDATELGYLACTLVRWCLHHQRGKELKLGGWHLSRETDRHNVDPVWQGPSRCIPKCGVLIVLLLNFLSIGEILSSCLHREVYKHQKWKQSKTSPTFGQLCWCDWGRRRILLSFLPVDKVKQEF